MQTGLRDIDNYYLQKEEPLKSCLLALREHILDLHPDITEAWKYRMPMFCFKGKMFCYLWLKKQTHQPYIGVVKGNMLDHPMLIQEKRARMKILLLDANEDLPLDLINEILQEAMKFYD